MLFFHQFRAYILSTTYFHGFKDCIWHIFGQNQNIDLLARGYFFKLTKKNFESVWHTHGQTHTKELISWFDEFSIKVGS
jgi:hypothetical protein